MLNNASELFKEIRFKRYRVKMYHEDAVSRFSSVPESIEDIEQEIAKQEIYLSKLHSRIASEENSNDKTLQEQLSEELWGLQRYVTSLKRKLKKLKSEKKNQEAEQIKNISKSKNEDKNENNTKLPDIGELAQNEKMLMCENSVLIESLQQVLEKISTEQILVDELQETISSNFANVNFVLPIPYTSQFPLQELIDNEQLLLNENKLLEERINLISKRINAEKEKIFELKLNIKLRTIENSGLDQHSSKIGADKDLVMTKL